jgi:regulator of protease activity HflC (stomatin/prohibitin superfamily)
MEAMSMQIPVGPGQELASAQITETRGWSAPGVLVLIVGPVVLVIALVLGLLNPGGAATIALIAIAALLAIAVALAFWGLTSVVAGEARVIQLFGQYRGSIRAAGLHWVNPLARKRRVSVRIRNHETTPAKVNDADGNPIEIAAVVVWQVADTARALYAVENFPEFVAIQTETAVRHTASSYPYTSHREGELSLRDNADEITARLSAEIADRVRPAGVQILESRLTRLSYAPEIAQAMLRQQQATAVVGARLQIVEGAVGMVRLALQRLEEEGVVELDEERKAAMVSNLLVVLCSEQATQQVVNTGSLYQ